MKTYEQVTAELNAKIPREVIAERDSGFGKKLSYLEGHYVINRLNEVLGVGNWAYAAEANPTHTGETADRFGKPRYVAHYISKVRLVVTLPGGLQTEFTDYGYGDGQDATSPGKPHELAVKEAVTDGLKRCAKNLGMSMGLALYDKTQENVEDSYEGNSNREVSHNNSGDSPRVEVVKEDEQKQVVGSVVKAPSKQEVLKSITSTSRVIIAKNIKTEEELRSYLKETYGVENKESLPLPKAKELLTYLQGVVNV